MHSAFQLHHVGYAVAQIEPMVQVYKQRYGYLVESGIIHEPLQTAFVQFLRLPGNESYLEFVAPDSLQSKLSSAVQKGGGLNHLCLICMPGIEQSIVHLEQEGMRLIGEPKPSAAFHGRRICWLLGADRVPVELVERLDVLDQCIPGETPSH